MQLDGQADQSAGEGAEGAGLGNLSSRAYAR